MRLGKLRDLVHEATDYDSKWRATWSSEPASSESGEGTTTAGWQFSSLSGTRVSGPAWGIKGTKSAVFVDHQGHVTHHSEPPLEAISGRAVREAGWSR